MVDGFEMIEISKEQKSEKSFKLATVTELFEDGTPEITFYGEDTPSEKQYSYLSSYHPVKNDMVFLLPFANSYIITGKVLFQITEDTPITHDELSSILEDYATKDDLSNYATTEAIANFIKAGDTVSGLTVTVFHAANVSTTGGIWHNGVLAFFGGAASSKVAVSALTATPTVDNLKTKLNELISALHTYNQV